MKFRNRHTKYFLVIAAFAMCIPFARARAQAPDQQQPNDSQSNPAQPEQPLPPADTDNNQRRSGPAPAARGLFLGGDAGSPGEPDSQMLSGGEALGLGTAGPRQNAFDFALHVSDGADTGIVQNQINNVGSFGGSLNLNNAWKRYKATLSYAAGDYLYYPDTSFNAPYQSFSLSQSLTLRRWTLRFRDDLTISPQSSFGGLDLGLLGTTIPSATGLGAVIPTVASNTESILTNRANRLSNIALAEIDYSLSRRSAITLTGSYGWLHFLDPGFIDSNYVNGVAGYNYLLSAKNSIALTYTFNETSFSTTSARIRNNLIQINVGRKISGRWAFQVSAGPELLELVHFGPATTQTLSWSAFTSLNYATRRAGYFFSYSHGISGGSGVFLGAETDTISASTHRQLTRYWTGTASGGYARNRNLVPIGPSANVNYWFTSATLARDLGRHFHLGFNYGFQDQTSNANCVLCGSTPTRHIGGVTLDWHFAPNADIERY